MKEHDGQSGETECGLCSLYLMFWLLLNRCYRPVWYFFKYMFYVDEI